MTRRDRVAVVPARGGSRGLPRKNLRELAGVPLVARAIRAALESECFGRVLVSSDDAEILELSERSGAETIARPAELATDSASSLGVLAHALRELGSPARCYALLQPTSPLRTARHVAEAVALRERKGARSLVSVTPSEHPPQKSLVLAADGSPAPLFDWASLTAPRQALQPTFRVNGAIYLGECETFLASGDLFAAPLVLYEMSAADSIDVDTAADLRLAELELANDSRGG